MRFLLEYYRNHLEEGIAVLQDVVVAPGLEALKTGWDRFLEEKSIAGDKP